MMKEKMKDRLSAIIIKSKKLLLVTGYAESFYWTPGGKVDEKEDHEEALKRELYEELNIYLVKLKKYLEYETLNEITNKKQKIYCYLVKFNGEIKPKGEITKCIWCSRKEIKEINASKGVFNYLLPKLIKDNLI